MNRHERTEVGTCVGTLLILFLALALALAIIFGSTA